MLQQIRKLETNGRKLPDACKILRHGDFFFTFAGTITNTSGSSAKYDARDILVRASKGLTSLTAIADRFDQLVANPLQKQIDDDFRKKPASFAQRTVSLEMIIFRVTSRGSEIAQSVFPLLVGKTAIVGKPGHRSCMAGVGDCKLTAGEQDGMKEYFDELPPTNDLAADAERLVKFEANRHPNEIGGKITVLLIDGTGVHSADTNDKCPINWGG